MKILIRLFLLLCLSSAKKIDVLKYDPKIIRFTKQIKLEKFPDAFNPSLIKIDQGFLLTFRYCPDRYRSPHVNYIGVVLLSDFLDPISEPQLLNSRTKGSPIPSQSEDARIFSYKDRLFLIYNDNREFVNPHTGQRRDMYLAELSYVDDNFTLSTPIKLIYEQKYYTQWWQKNWVPFDWQGTLLMIYSINPHEIIYPNLTNGRCYHSYESWSMIQWDLGPLRSSTPPLLVDGEYLAFFHSGCIAATAASADHDLWHYFMGAYTFAAEPPFEIKKVSPAPLIGKDFYTSSNREKRVIFPGGFVIKDSTIYLAYGKDDFEIWIAAIDKLSLLKSLVPVHR